MIEGLKQYFDFDDYKYLIDNLIKIEDDLFRLKISTGFFANKEHYNAKGFLDKNEICKLINKQQGGVSRLLFCYQKIGIINSYKLVDKKTAEQEEFYAKFQGSKYWDYSIKSTCFDYEINLNLEKLIFFNEAVFKNGNYGIPTRCINELIILVSFLGIKYDELLDYLKIEESSNYYYKENSLLIFSMSRDLFLIKKLIGFIEIVSTDNHECLTKLNLVKELLGLITKNTVKLDYTVIFNGTDLVNNSIQESLGGFEQKLCEYFFITKKDQGSEEIGILLEHIYGAEKASYKDSLKSLYKSVNKKAKKLGISEQLFSSVGGARIKNNLFKS